MAVIPFSELSPMLLSTGAAIPADASRWAMQPKWDGVRVLVCTRTDGARWRSRHGTDLTGLAPVVDAALRAVPADTVLDGELICPVAVEGGVSQHFGAVREAVFTRRASTALALVAWDVLVDTGQDVRALPWADRQARLERLIPDGQGPLLRCPSWEPSQDRLDALLVAGWEGAVVKRTDGRYRCAERCLGWTKHKGRFDVVGTVVDLGSLQRGREPRALVRLANGDTCWALAFTPPEPGRDATVRYARRDADGALRDARLVL